MAEKTCSHCVHVDVCENRFSWLDQADNTKHIICHHFKPAADVVEVVRCKDCRFCFDGCCLEPRNGIVFRVPDFGDHYGYAGRIMVAEDHFCGYGERKENNHG